MRMTTAPAPRPDRNDWTAKEIFFVFVWSVFFAILFCHPLLTHMRYVSLGEDWDFFWQERWAELESIRHFRQFPFWNPYVCGGVPLFADTQSSLLTPWFLLDFIAAPFVGVHLEILIHLSVAWIGGYLLARAIGLSPLGAFGTASFFPASSWYYLQLAAGHLSVMPAAYLPWIAALTWIGIERRKLSAAAVAGLLVALTFLEGGP